MTGFKALSNLYETELREHVIPFWENNSIDKQYGGFFTSLNREGQVFDTDKFIWLQARQVWTFAKFYNEIEQNDNWLQIAIHGGKFLEKHAHDGNFNWYFSLNQKGDPLVQPYNIFSDCFATMAFAQLYKATGESKYAQIAKKTFDNILLRRNNPKGKYEKSYPGTRGLKNFALPMILCNLSLEIEHLLEEELVQQTINESIYEVMEVFFHKETGLILENVHTDGSFSDTYQGRLLNPGHAIEAMWFMMDLGERIGDKTLINTAVDITLNTVDYGWDKEYGGIFYFMDFKKHPTEQLEWDQKLWWVHLETLISLIKGYKHTQNEQCLQWFEKVHDYTWSHFPDNQYGEWWGYLNRRGEVSLSLKGGKWKGCFHVPRGLYQCWKILNELK
ncbi:MAG: N-acylglucosamine 2-epimerase [Draconibacterium sp.]|nr:MAG: N-acylglucosamine 2-epimerase [Draconibacterium sp.]